MVEGKQVKVDNWGIFFLQRLQQFYNKTFFCDLTLQFEDNVQLKVHRLVMNACTEYFQMLENTCKMEKDCLIMPSNLPSDVVIPIINFMYSGILEFQETLFDRLYTTAKLMNMSVLTKLLDAQKNPIKPIAPVPKRVQSVTPITWNLQGKKIMTKGFTEPDLPETLPGRKLPIWKRKSAPSSVSYVSANSSGSFDNFSSKSFKSSTEEAPKPTRFEWPEEDESNFENSFDDISYTSKPLILPSFSSVKEKNPKPSTSSTFEEIKRTAMPVKRSASPVGNQCKKVNIQDVKEYLKEQKLRSDFIDYDDSEMADNDLQTYDNDDSNEECSKDASDIFTQSTDESPSKSILKNESSAGSTNKHVRFSLEGKENTEVKIQSLPGKPQIKSSSSKTEPNVIDMDKHTKIITEVLKKYPHLVKNNKNIRLKILAKGNNSANTKPTKTQISAKPVSKVSYMVMKPDPNQKSNIHSAGDKEINSPDAKSWECTRCEEPRPFKSYQTYRQHLTEVHNEKQDSQMCILCGHISRKQNMLVYHKYVKHNIPPPAMYNFPKCKDCDHIALSQTLLLKHQLTHTVTCHECGTMFTSKAALTSHSQQTGHSQDKVTPNYGCNYCDKRFFSENILNTHIKRSHEVESKQIKEPVKIEIDDVDVPSTSKEKIKILSDIKVNTNVPSGTLVPVRSINELRTIKHDDINASENPEPLEPSSEAEALSNVASGIAASLGLVDTIVVLDENQFILQSTQHGNIQDTILNNTEQDYIIPDMRISNLTTIASNSINQVSEHPTVTLSANTNTVLTQSLTKSGITSTDELVMVLTDHDYSDAASNAVITDNNIVVLYSHPVQSQAMMISSESGMIEVDKNYSVTSEIPVSVADQVVNCEESIEMIQQEINNQLDADTETQQNIEMHYVQQNVEHNVQSMVEENMEIDHCREIEQSTYQVCSDNVSMVLGENQENETHESLQMEEIPSNNQVLETSIQIIHKNVDTVPREITEEIISKVCEEQINENPIRDTSNILENTYQAEIKTENTYETTVSNMKFSQDLYPGIITEIADQTSEEQITKLSANIAISDQCLISTKKDNDLENKKLTNEVKSACNSEDSQKSSEVSFPLDMCEQSQEQIVSKPEIIEVSDTLEYSKKEGQVMVKDEIPDSTKTPKEKSENSQENATDKLNENIYDITKNNGITNEMEEDKQENVRNKEINQETNFMVEGSHKIIENMRDTQENKIQAMEERLLETRDIESENNEIVQNKVESINQETTIKIYKDIKSQLQNSETLENMNKETDENSFQMAISNRTDNNIESQATEPIAEITKTSSNSSTASGIKDSNMEIESPVQDVDMVQNLTAGTEDKDSNEFNDYKVFKGKEIENINNKTDKKEMSINVTQKENISQLLDDWDDGDTDSQQSFSKSVPPETPNSANSINKLIDDWEDDEDT